MKTRLRILARNATVSKKTLMMRRSTKRLATKTGKLLTKHTEHDNK